MKKLFFPLILCAFFNVYAEDGYDLWLRYKPTTDSQHKVRVGEILQSIVISNQSPTSLVIQAELARASQGMLDVVPSFSADFSEDASLVIEAGESSEILQTDEIRKELEPLGAEGYFIGYTTYKEKKYLLLAANEPVGALYGTFHLLRLLQSGLTLPESPIIESPKIKYRLLNHWDNIDRTVERGYAGFSIWDWHKLPQYIDPRYIDYARANASIGINGAALTNVNANSIVLTSSYIQKVAALADTFRPYGIKVYLTARFSSPIELGGLPTADPLAPEVRKWWQGRVEEIYKSIPDFGGFLVKANSEGQPGPQDYGRTHADGANMLADALTPFGGIVMWRGFVYSNEQPEDRFKQAYTEFKPLDGEFRDNVTIQVKNGPIDFQPREPFSPLFGAMKKTPLMMEFQITQEYLGQGTHLVYLAPLFKEVLQADTYARGKGSFVSQVVDGSLDNHQISGIAGVSNIGTDRDWTGHQFGQANWYAFGRLAWNHQTSSEEIAEEWIRQTFGNSGPLVETIKQIMLPSREAVVNYMTPLGLHHIMGRSHHYGPGPWVTGGRADWTSVYYHKADSKGIGFDRTESGSNALNQYANEINEYYSSLQSCPDEYLLWFHHVPWDYTMRSGNTLWEELCLKYDEGVRSAGQMKDLWSSVENSIDPERFQQVRSFLEIQESDAKWWRNACLLYFQGFSKMSFPSGMEQPEGNLEAYMELQFPYAPGIRPSW